MPMLKNQKSKNKKIALLILPILILTVAVGGTVAYIIERTIEVENTFAPVIVDSAPVGNAQGGVAVVNNGDIPAYLRAVVVVNWVAVDSDGNTTDHRHMDAPVEGVDYSIAYDTTGSWLKRSDGFWYCKEPINAGATTQALISSITRLSEPPEEGYVLFMEIATTGIQSVPSSAVEQAWGVTISCTTIIN